MENLEYSRSPKHSKYDTLPLSRLELCKNPSSVVTVVFELLIGSVFTILALVVTDEILTVIIVKSYNYQIKSIEMEQVLLKYDKLQKAAAKMYSSVSLIR